MSEWHRLLVAFVLNAYRPLLVLSGAVFVVSFTILVGIQIYRFYAVPSLDQSSDETCQCAE
mgnify:CR=1 FL=1|tara:strand:- start:105911 stop:106093 length:183 start_codon:yes stop_codon:yes gene_type:complete